MILNAYCKYLFTVPRFYVCIYRYTYIHDISFAFLICCAINSLLLCTFFLKGESESGEFGIMQYCIINILKSLIKFFSTPSKPTVVKIAQEMH